MSPISILPESAPFNEEQRAWLDGFLAGWLGIQGNSSQSMLLMQEVGEPVGLLEVPQQQQEEAEEFPWHDPGIPLEDRLELAAEKPLPRKLMAAMAQLDCGTCGYDCQKYAEAIASGEEKSLKLCSPGGAETAKRLKELVKRHAGTPAVNGVAQQRNVSTQISTKATRNTPYPAKILTIRNLNGPGSDKQTSHVEIDLTGSGISYSVGDALGVYPTNCDELVRAVIQELRANGDDRVSVDERDLLLRTALKTEFSLSEITDELLSLLSQCCGDLGESKLLEQFLEDDDPISGWDVLDLLKHFPSARLSAVQLTSALSRIAPRLYSISSSLQAHPNQVHLTVGKVSWEFKKRVRKGVASTMFAERLQVGSEVRVFVQKSHGFTVPADPTQKMIMVGPGTGIAPFRAFLEERIATGASGENWLFFGDQQQSTDFLYRDELEQMLKSGKLSRLDLAFSRDQEQKVYVQDRMREQGEELWLWISSGAHFYVCGDARRMAVDVDQALKQIVTQYGNYSPAAASAYVNEMQKTKRYSRDVY